MPSLYPLTAFEEYMLVDDSVDHPMTFFLRADLVGSVDFTQLSAAFSQVVRRHPLLLSTVVRRFGRCYWQMVREWMPSLALRLDTATRPCDLTTHIDLRREPGVRAQLHLVGDVSQLWLQFHHSCNDGIGALRFLQELLDTYRQRLAGGGPSTDAEPAEFPTRRCAFQNLSWLARSQRWLPDLTGLCDLLRRRLVQIVQDCGVSGPTLSRSATLSFLESRLPLSAPMLTRLKHAHAWAPTVNDVLLRDFYLGLADWLQLSSPRKLAPWIRIAAATNLRSPDAPFTGCHNDVSLVFLDRRLGELDDVTQLLRGISAEMSRVKRDRMGCTLLRGLHLSRLVPGGIALVTKLRRVYATAIMSNLGSIFPLPRGKELKVGDATVTQFGFLVPIRRGTPISFGILTHAEELTIGMQYDDGIITVDRAQQLLECITVRLRYTLGLWSEQAGEQRWRRAA